MNTKYYRKSRIFPEKIQKTKKKFIEKPYLSRFGGFIEIFINELKENILTYKERMKY